MFSYGKSLAYNEENRRRYNVKVSEHFRFACFNDAAHMKTEKSDLRLTNLLLKNVKISTTNNNNKNTSKVGNKSVRKTIRSSLKNGWMYSAEDIEEEKKLQRKSMYRTFHVVYYRKNSETKHM